MIANIDLDKLAPTPLRAPLFTNSSLPVPLTSLIGREREVVTISTSLRQQGTRLVTLTGPGGVGKTRLAIEVASSLLSAFPAGVTFVPLSQIRDPALVLPTIASWLDVGEAGERSGFERLVATLGTNGVLLVLDNLEQVIDVAPRLAELLAACPGLKILATSRSPLRISGERDFRTRPLSLPDCPTSAATLTGTRAPTLDELANNDAIRLFVERAHAARADFELTGENAADIAEICRRLDGLPLAIELAAARVRIAAPALLLARLEQRLPLLTDGPRDQPQRLRTMRDAISWSYELLNEQEQRLFRRLATFSGGFTLDAAEAVGVVAGEDGFAVFDGVAALLDASLLRQETGRRSGGGDEPRYAMLETIREFGREQLATSDEEAAARRAHAAYFADLVRRSSTALRRYNSSEGATWRGRLATEEANLRDTLAWHLEHSTGEDTLRLATWLGWLWFFSGQSREGRIWVEQAIAACPDVSAEVLAAARDSVAWLAWEHGDRPAALAYAEAALATFIGPGSSPIEGCYTLHLAGMVTQDLGDLERGENLLRQALDAYRALGNASLAGQTIADIAAGRWALGDLDGADALFAESLELIVDSHEELLAVHPLVNVAGMALERGDLARANETLGEALRLTRNHEYLRGLPGCFDGIATLAKARGELVEAARLLGAGESLRQAIGRSVPPLDRERYERLLAALRAGLSEEDFAVAWDGGRHLAVEEAVDAATAILAGPSLPVIEETPTPASESGLTERELEVLAQLAAGKTNLEIAEVLYIGRGTVRTHVSNILAKLGAKTRTEAADLARRRGLL